MPLLIIPAVISIQSEEEQTEEEGVSDEEDSSGEPIMG